MASDKVIVVSDADFEEKVLKSKLPVLIDFWAPWCGPCRMMSPVIDEVAEAYEGKLVVAKMNVDENPKTPPEFGIRSIPNLMFFKNGERITDAEILGAAPRPKLDEAIGKVL